MTRDFKAHTRAFFHAQLGGRRWLATWHASELVSDALRATASARVARRRCCLDLRSLRGNPARQTIGGTRGGVVP